MIKMLLFLAKPWYALKNALHLKIVSIENVAKKLSNYYHWRILQDSTALVDLSFINTHAPPL
jgi:hypothetical protein